jgi:hypothetical protein
MPKIEEYDVLRELETAACMAGKTKYNIVNRAEVVTMMRKR